MARSGWSGRRVAEAHSEIPTWSTQGSPPAWSTTRSRASRRRTVQCAWCSGFETDRLAHASEDSIDLAHPPRGTCRRAIGGRVDPAAREIREVGARGRPDRGALDGGALRRAPLWRGPASGGGWSVDRLCAVLPQLLDVSGEARHVPRGPVRASGPSRSWRRPRTARPPRTPCHRARMRPSGVGRAELEPGSDPLLRAPWRAAEFRVDRVPPDRRGSPRAWPRIALQWKYCARR